MAETRVSRWAPLVALAVVVAAHVGLTLYFLSPAVVLGSQPIGGFDWEVHYGQAHDAVEAFRAGGHAWAYEPQRLAGQPTGVIFDANNKAWEVWTVGLGLLGVAPHRAFNLFVWLVCLLQPPVVWLAARLFGLGRAAASVAAALGSACFFFDGFAHWCTWVGMVSWAGASYGCLLPLALFWHWLARRSVLALGGLLAALVVVLGVHPYAFGALVVPMALLYLRRRKALERRHHAALGAVVVATILAHAWWLWPSLRFWHYALEARSFLDARWSYLLTDYLGLTQEPHVTGVMAMRSGFRFLTLGAAGACLWWWRKERDQRFAPFAAALGALLVLAYLGGHLSTVQLVQPYRFVLPAIYLATIPAASFLERAASALATTRPHAVVQAVLALALLVAVPRLVRDVIYFVPETVPRFTRPLPAPPPDINAGIPFGTIRWPEPFDFRHRPAAHRDMAKVAEYVNATDDGSGRWLVDWWPLGERLAWATDAQILGGFTEINLAHSDANLFRRYADAPLPPPEELGSYLRQYNVHRVILSQLNTPLERQLEGQLELETAIFNHRVFRVRDAGTFFVEGGPGTVVAKLNELVVRGTPGGSMVLRYHWLETLRCEPGCRLRQVATAGDRVGFIGVDDAPADFRIFNAY